jgi:beta-glucosidase
MYTSQTPSLIPASAFGEGLVAEYFDNADLQGEPKVKRTESRPMPQPGIPDPALSAIPSSGYSVRWTGTLRPPVTGEYGFSIRGGGARIFLDDKELTAPARASLESGHSYEMRIEWRPQGPFGGSLRLLWIPPAEPLMAAAIDAVKNADVAVVFVGLNPNLEGEEMRVNLPGFSGGDRTTLDLPPSQEQLVRAAIATGKPVVVVLASGSALSVPYAAEHAAAVLESWYNGEEAGSAIAETLAGVNNPAGRLPVTFYRSVDQLPPFDDYNMNGRTYRYFNGDPLWGFGYGLSYSKFLYSNLRAERSGKGGRVSVRVKNDSQHDGDEVVQLYFAGTGDLVRQLRGFQRAHLKAGEIREVEFAIPAGDLPKDKVKISVGGGQPTGSVPRVDGVL